MTWNLAMLLMISIMEYVNSHFKLKNCINLQEILIAMPSEIKEDKSLDKTKIIEGRSRYSSITSIKTITKNYLLDLFIM